MSKVRVRFRTRTKEYYYKDKYKTKTFNIELPLCDCLVKTINVSALSKLIRDLVDAEYPETYNSVLRWDVVKE
jgi:hypothetical protein